MWKNLNIPKNNIVTETPAAVLFKCPKNSDYKNFVFWHPNKLIRPGRNSGAVAVGYTDDFIFTLKKYGQGKYNYNKIIAEKTITAAEFEKLFLTIDKNIIARA